MSIYPDPLSSIIWAIGWIILHAACFAVVLTPFMFALLWAIKCGAQQIFPAPKNRNE